MAKVTLQMTVDLRVSLKLMSIADFQNSAINSLVISINCYSSLSLQVKTGGELIHSTDEDNKLKVHVNFRLFFLLSFLSLTYYYERR